MLVRRPQRHVAAPRLPARLVEIGAVLPEQTQELRPAAAPDGVRNDRSFVRIRAAFQEQPNVLETIVVERVREGVRPPRLCAVLE
jgi:hypothetical protein